MSFNHSCYWITQLSVGLCGWLSQHSAAASSDLGNKAQVTVWYCVLLPGKHFRCCPWPRQTVASLVLNVFVLVNSQLVLMFHYMVNYCHQWNSTTVFEQNYIQSNQCFFHLRTISDTGCNSYSSPCCTWYYNYITSSGRYNFLTWIFPDHLLSLATV